MAENNRIAIKWIRDKAKKAYVKDDHCYICGTTEHLELHHLHSLTRLLKEWAKRYQVDIDSDAAVLSIRDEFIEAHQVEIFDMVYTLCNDHHTRLHRVYGKIPKRSSVDKQVKWMDLQREKILNPLAKQASVAKSPFSKLLQEDE